MISQQNIDAVKNRIVDFLHPEKIILFGSYSNDTADEDSDLDILVVHKTNIPRKERRLPLRKALRDFDFPMDIVIYTPEEIDNWKDASMAFITRIVSEGKTIYAKQ
ncbi:MAG: nucleotidyltransferase domain-containing protein [Bacteroidetes bacterium]|nr:nucleotidyltransferase domain-containing protein [Bacteroidota bacterium]